MVALRIKRLEHYSQLHPQEVLRLMVASAESPQEILIFRGFSSSLTDATAFDPDVPMLTDADQILKIERMRSPFNPANPDYLVPPMTWEEMDVWLQSLGL